MRVKKWTMSTSLKILLCIFWLFAIVLPLIRMLSTMATVDISAVISTRKFSKALMQSLTVSSTATLISVTLAGILSWAVARTNIRHKTILTTLITVPMLLPSISHGMGLIIILGANGWLSRLLGLTSGIYGFWGIVIGSVMYSFPVAYLMLYDVLRYEDGTPYEAAEVMGLKPKDKFFAITLPYLRKPLISVIFAAFTMIITDYGVPLMVGGKYMTLPVMMYQDVIGMLDFGKGSVIGMILLIPALIACFLDMANRDKGNSAFVGKPYAIKESNTRDQIARAIIAFLVLLVFLPIGSFARYDVFFRQCGTGCSDGRAALSEKLLGHCRSCLFPGNCAGCIQRIYDCQKSNDAQLRAAFDVHHIFGHSRSCTGSFLCDVFQNDTYLRHLRYAVSCELHALLRVSLSDGV